MGRLLLVYRLVRGNLRRRPVEAALLLLTIATVSATLTMSLAMAGVMDQPYARTRAATAGPDAVANMYCGTGDQPAACGPADLARLTGLAAAPGVTGHTGPYPDADAVLSANGYTSVVTAEGRDAAPAAVDQPEVTDGTWVRPGGVVVERGFAELFGITVGRPVTMNGRTFRVVGLAVTAAVASIGPDSDQQVWLTRADAESRGMSRFPLGYTLNLRLTNPAAATAFADAHSSDTGAYSLVPWQSISQDDAKIIAHEQRALMIGSWLIGLLAIASVAVLVGGRMAEQTRRVGLIKAVGGTPRVVAAVLLTEDVLLAVVAAAIGITVGRFAAPLLTAPGSSLIGAAGAPSLTPATVGVVAGIAIIVAGAATFVPSLRAARTSTIRALADAARAPRRRGLLIRVSRRLPTPMLLGLRLVARRPRRAVLTALGVMITVATVVIVLCVHANTLGDSTVINGITSIAPRAPKVVRIDQVINVITVVLVVMASVNAVFVTWATAADARRPLGVARALGASPRQVRSGLSTALVIPAIAGGVLGIPAGYVLFNGVNHGTRNALPPAWELLAVVLGTIVAMVALTLLPAHLVSRRPATAALQAELA